MGEGEVEGQKEGGDADLLNIGFHVILENCAQLRCKKFCQKFAKIGKPLQILIIWKIYDFNLAQIRKICCQTSNTVRESSNV